MIDYKDNIAKVFGIDFLKLMDSKNLENVFDFTNNEIFIDDFVKVIISDINTLLKKIFHKQLTRLLNIKDFDFSTNNFLLRISNLIAKNKPLLIERKLYDKCLFKVYFIWYTKGTLTKEEFEYSSLKRAKEKEVFLNNNINFKKLFLRNISLLNRKEIIEYFTQANKGAQIYKILLQHFLLNLEINDEVHQTLFLDENILKIIKEIKCLKKSESFRFSPLEDDDIYLIHNFYIYLFYESVNLNYEKLYNWFLKLIKECNFSYSNLEIEEEYDFSRYISSSINVSKIPKLFTYLKLNKNNDWEYETIKHIKEFFNMIQQYLCEYHLPILDVLLNDYEWHYFNIYHLIDEDKDEIFNIFKKILKMNLNYEQWPSIILQKMKEKIIKNIIEIFNKNIKGIIEDKLKIDSRKNINLTIQELENKKIISKNKCKTLDNIRILRNKFAHKRDIDIYNEYLAKDLKDLKKQLDEIKKYSDFLANFTLD